MSDRPAGGGGSAPGAKGPGDADERFRAVLEALPDAKMIEAAGRLLYVNPACARLLGHERTGDLIGASAEECFHPDDRAKARERAAAALAGGPSPGPVELRLLSRDKGAVAVEVLHVALSFGGGPAVLDVVADLRPRREVEAQLQLADRMISLGTLAAGLAHELNNPLGYVIGNLGYLADGLSKLRGLGEERGADVRGLEDALQEIWDGAKRVRDIVHDLKTFSRTDVERREAVALRRVLDAAIRLSRNELRHCASVSIELPDELPPVEGDTSRLSQVLLNLLLNAAQAMPDRPAQQNRIRISARAERGRVSIEVEDNGVGMTSEVRKRIFDPFFTTKPVGLGTGLGLAIVHSIVSSLRGDIEVESEAGKGSTFRITLPKAAPRPAPAAGGEPVPRDVHARVLVIDDEPLVGTSIRRVLAGEHEVVAVTQASEALRRIVEGERFDALLCDLMMPEMTGMDLHAELARVAPDQAEKMGFLTGGTFTRRASGFAERMGDRTLAKPFNTEALRAFVRRLSRR